DKDDAEVPEGHTEAGAGDFAQVRDENVVAAELADGPGEESEQEKPRERASRGGETETSETAPPGRGDHEQDAKSAGRNGKDQRAKRCAVVRRLGDLRH